MREKWLVFRDSETGRELCAYTIRGTFAGERQETIKQLAADNGIKPERITTTLETRQTGRTTERHRETGPDALQETIREALARHDIELEDATLRALARRIRRQQGDEPTCTSVYTDQLQALAEWAERVDTGDITQEDFTELRALRPRIERAYKGGRYQRPEYNALMTIYWRVETGAHVVLDIPPDGGALDQTAEE